MKTANTYDRKAIMNRAWAIYRSKAAWLLGMNAAGKREMFKSALRQSWMEVKSPEPTESPARQEIRTAISMLENKSFRYDISAERPNLQVQLEAA